MLEYLQMTRMHPCAYMLKNDSPLENFQLIVLEGWHYIWVIQNVYQLIPKSPTCLANNQSAHNYKYLGSIYWPISHMKWNAKNIMSTLEL